jgi:uncharacterized protein (TIGR00299 family) protein
VAAPLRRAQDKPLRQAQDAAGRIGYLDCFSGVSGDMLLGALLDAGLPRRALEAELSRLKLRGYRLEVSKAQRAGLAATRVEVVPAGKPPPHRRLPDILSLIEGSGLPAADRERGSLVFRRLAEAEGRVHGLRPEEVGFHEVGGVDTLVDVMGAVAGLRLLEVGELYCSPLPAGGGEARGAHGVLPVPAPATLELLARAGAPLTSPAGEPPFELVTPTGAAIVTALARFQRPAMRVTGVGYGAGARDLPGRPNVLRLWLGERIAEQRGSMLLIETNIDDMSPELFGYVQERLFEAGAADVWFAPIQMKKNRPATLLSVLCPHEREEAVVAVLLRETSTLGVRISEVARQEAGRENLEFESSLGPAAVKVKRLEGEEPQVSPEYEACRRLALNHPLPLAEVYRIVSEEALALLKKNTEHRT